MAGQITSLATTPNLILDGIDYTNLGLAEQDYLSLEEPEEDASKTLVGKTGDVAKLGNVQSLSRKLTIRALYGSLAYTSLQNLTIKSQSALTTGGVYIFNGSFTKMYTSSSTSTITTYSSNSLSLTKWAKDVAHANSGDDQALAIYVVEGVWNVILQ